MRISGKYIRESRHAKHFMPYVDGPDDIRDEMEKQIVRDLYNSLRRLMQPDKWYAVKLNSIEKSVNEIEGMMQLYGNLEIMYDPESDELEPTPVLSMSPEEYGSQLMQVLNVLAKGYNEKDKK